MHKIVKPELEALMAMWDRKRDGTKNVLEAEERLSV